MGLSEVTLQRADRGAPSAWSPARWSDAADRPSGRRLRRADGLTLRGVRAGDLGIAGFAGTSHVDVNQVEPRAQALVSLG